MLRPLIAALVIVCSPLVLAVGSDSKDAAPDLSETDVQSLFGDRLENADRAENLLLLAIALDHQSQETPTRDALIGIPYIADAGPGYWVMLLQQEGHTPRLSTLVNNALILAFLEELGHSQHVRQEASSKLLTIAASQGYWPAKVYLAERKMAHWRDLMTTQVPLRSEGPTEVAQGELEQVFSYLTDCSHLGFAPCQFRLGFWYLQDENKQDAAIEYLRAGIEIVRRDARYTQSKESMMDMTNALRVLSTPLSGLPSEERDAYLSLLQEVEAILETGGA